MLLLGLRPLLVLLYTLRRLISELFLLADKKNKIKPRYNQDGQDKTKINQNDPRRPNIKTNIRPK